MRDQCDSCISPENGGFDVRWVRFPKYITLCSEIEKPSRSHLPYPDQIVVAADGKQGTVRTPGDSPYWFPVPG